MPHRMTCLEVAKRLAITAMRDPKLTLEIASHETREKMQLWEKEHLPPAGLPRILARIYKYLQKNGENVADQFKIDTNGLTRLPD